MPHARSEALIARPIHHPHAARTGYGKHAVVSGYPARLRQSLSSKSARTDLNASSELPWRARKAESTGKRAGSAAYAVL